MFYLFIFLSGREIRATIEEEEEKEGGGSWSAFKCASQADTHVALPKATDRFGVGGAKQEIKSKVQRSAVTRLTADISDTGGCREIKSRICLRSVSKSFLSHCWKQEVSLFSPGPYH